MKTLHSTPARWLWLAGALLAAFGLHAGAALAATQGRVIQNTALFAGPSGDYPVVITLREGEPLTVFGCLEDYAWCDASRGGARGWVDGDLVETYYQGQRVALGGYMPLLGLPFISFTFDDYWNRYYIGRPWYSDRGRWASWNWHSHDHRWRHGDRNDWDRDGRHHDRDRRHGDRNDWDRDGRHHDRDRRHGDRNDWDRDGRHHDRDRGHDRRNDEGRTGHATSPAPRQSSTPRVNQRHATPPAQRDTTTRTTTTRTTTSRGAVRTAPAGGHGRTMRTPATTSQERGASGPRASRHDNPRQDRDDPHRDDPRRR